MSIYSGSNGFSLLTDNTYYATMDYGVKSNKINGKMYLIINTDNNIVISLMSNISSDFNKNSDRILDILKTINIQKKYDNELSDKEKLERAEAKIKLLEAENELLKKTN